MITLLDKAALLCLYITPVPIMDYAEEGVARSLMRLSKEGLIEYKDGQMHDPNNFTVTERGKVLCEAMRDVPLPISKWVIPSSVSELNEPDSHHGMSQS